MPAPAIRVSRRFVIAMKTRKCLNLPPVITRRALADQLAARLCRECGKAEARKAGKTCLHYSKFLPCWQVYVRGVVVRHFGKGDGLN